MAALESTAGGTDADRPWARRALAVAYASAGRTAEAEASATALTTETETGHEVVGHTVLVRLAVEANSAALAVDRLVSFAAIATDTLAAEAFGSALALVAASFPDADLSAVAGGPAGRGVSAGDAALASAKPDGTAAEDGVSMWPNPASGRGTVRLAVSTAATGATVLVYDALGRRVAVLHDGPLSPGVHDFAFDASALAPGVYVVQVRVTPSEGGAAWTDVRRVTVVR